MTNPPPPDLSDWLVYCNHCKEDRRVSRRIERDTEAGEVYHEWTCRKCDTALLRITRAKPSERELLGKPG
jgi:hypothetical protein